MQSNKARAGVVVASVILLAVLFVLFEGSDDELDPSTTETQAQTTITETVTGPTGEEPSTSKEPNPEPKPDPIETIVVEGGEPKGGVADLNFSKGEKVEFKVNSDVADEIHVHGYDLFEEVEAGGTAKFDFEADADGIYEVELEGAGVELARLTIKP